MSSADFDTVRLFLDGTAKGREALARIQAENERLRLRDKMRDDGEHHLLGEIEARDKEIERLRAQHALTELTASAVTPAEAGPQPSTGSGETQ